MFFFQPCQQDEQDDFRNSMDTSLFKYTSLIKFSKMNTKSDRFFRDEKIVDKCPTPCNVEESFNKFLYSVSGKKGATLFLPVTPRNSNRFSKFFYHHALQ